jgi:hypothetical protein
MSSNHVYTVVEQNTIVTKKSAIKQRKPPQLRSGLDLKIKVQD